MIRSLIPEDHAKQVQFMDALQCAYLGEKTDTFGTGTKEARIKASNIVRSRIVNYAKQPGEIAKRKSVAAVKATMTSSDLPEMTTNSFDVIYAQQQYDTDWMLAFKSVPVDPGKNFFEIATIDNGLSVKLVPEGAKLSLEKLTGSKVIVSVNKYGQGIQWTDEMIRFRQLGLMAEIGESQIEAHWADKADRHYAALRAAAVSNASTAYQSTTGNAVVDNDIDTLGQAYSDLVVDNKDAFRGITANVNVLLYLPIEAKTRINRAMRKLINDVQGSDLRVPWTVTPVYTLNESIATTATGDSFTGVMVLPQRKIQTGQVLAPTIYSEQDILSLSYIQTAWEYFGSGIGLNKQCRLVNFD
jgi:hypothetical protein